MSTLTTEVPLTDPELKLLQTLVYQECGMYFDERRTHFLRDRLQRRLKACQLDSFYAYYRLLTSREGRSELALLLENLTVNETSFFRNRPQLDLLQKSVLEEILRRKQERRDYTLRVWSAGCSAGQEPYTVAILICDALAYYYLRNPLPFEMPSPMDDRTKTSRARRISGISFRSPSRRTRSPIASSLTSVASCSRQGPSPTITRTLFASPAARANARMRQA